MNERHKKNSDDLQDQIEQINKLIESNNFCNGSLHDMGEAVDHLRDAFDREYRFSNND